MKKLSRDDMKNVIGGYNEEAAGGTCCAHSSDWTSYECGLTKAEAKEGALGLGGLWCCASCPSGAN